MEAVRAAFPQARVDRLDRDRAARRGELREGAATRSRRGRRDILVGTQMIAKGHDFPRVTLVGVIDADVGLGLPDFRAAERTFQLLTQVAGRAGPGRPARRGHPAEPPARPLRAPLRLHAGLRELLRAGVEFRRTMAYPPAAALVNLVVRGKDAAVGRAGSGRARPALRETAPRRGRYRVLGPARAPLARLRAGAPVPDPPEGRARRDAGGGARRARPSATAKCAGRASWSTSTR